MRLLPILWLAVALGASAEAQTTGEAERTALAHVAARSTGEAVVTGVSRSGRSRLTYVYLRPAVGGVEVADDPALVVVDGAGTVVYARGTVDAGIVESDAERVGPAEAARRASDALGLAGITAAGDPAARRVFVRTAAGALRLVWEVALYPADPAAWAVVQIDAATGDVLGQRLLAVFESGHGDRPPGAVRDVAGPDAADPVSDVAAPARVTDGASYLAFPGRSPLDGDRVLLRAPALALASPYGWHDTDARPGPEFTTTRGNNVHVFPDRDANGLPDAAGVPDGGAALVFAPPLDLAAEPSSSTAASAVNAFVWANRFHDVLYAYGFDEAGGNFQANAYGRAGGAAGADPVSLRVQSGSGTDNAYMVVPPDGTPPVLTLFEGTRTTPRRDYALDTEVVLHESAHGLTSRLTGGPADASCLGVGAEDQGLAEGWSDWYALMLTARPGDARADARRYGTYTGGPDVRLAPYSTDFAVNGTTYASTVGMTGRHAVGLVWATVLWEIAWDLIRDHGFDPDLTNARGLAGNQIALSLVTEALRLQPCRPGLVDARNAILLADLLLYDNAHYGVLQTAFARRGLGRDARQGSTGTNADNVASFEVETGLADIVPPAAVTGLTATALSSSDIRIDFTAPGDDGTSGTAARYEVRSDVTPIETSTQFDAARAVDGVAAPRPAGTAESVIVTGLAPSRTHYIAVRAVDDAGNAAPITSASALTPPITTPPAPPPLLVDILADSLVLCVEQGQMVTASVTVRNLASTELSLRGRVVQYNGPTLLGLVQTDESTLPPATPVSDLGATGTEITAWLPSVANGPPSDDLGYADITLPFAFPFDGETFTTLRVHTDGFVTFVPARPGTVVNPALGNPALPNAVLAPFWTNLRVGPFGRVHTGTLPDGRFAVQYDRMTVTGASSDSTASFSILLAPSGAFAFEYGDVLPAVSGVVRGAEGFQGYNPDVLSGRALPRTRTRFDPPVSILSVPLSVAVVPQGGTAIFSVTADARLLAPGRYDGVFSVSPIGGWFEFFVSDRVLVHVEVTPRGPAPPPAGPPAVDLRPARPNPVRGVTTVTYGIPEAVPVRLAVYDARGREVATLVEGTVEAGWHDAVWRLESAAAGLYVVRLVAGGEVRTATVVVVR